MPNKVTFSLKKIILGDPDNMVASLAISVGRSLIMRPAKLSLKLFIMNLKIYVMNEKCMARKRCRLLRFEEVWGEIDAALNDV